MKNIFDDVIITSPERCAYNPVYTVKLSKMQRKGWFITEIFGGQAWCIKRAANPVLFKSRCVSIKFNCDREQAEKELKIIAEQKYSMYQKLLKGKRYEG